MNVPNYVFIIPYRDRQYDMTQYTKLMPKILEDIEGQYEVIFSHQGDNRHFNRGAMKNLGFIYVKRTYPNDYKNIHLIFQDIDTIPMSKDIIHFDTKEGEIKHYYGFKQALGGIFSIRASDFEILNGFPNFWGWGFEDNVIQERAEKANMIINRDDWFKNRDENYYNFHSTDFRNVNNSSRAKYNETRKQPHKGITEITNIKYQIISNHKKYNMKIVNFTKWNILEKATDSTYRRIKPRPKMKDVSPSLFHSKSIMGNILNKRNRRT